LVSPSQPVLMATIDKHVALKGNSGKTNNIDARATVTTQNFRSQQNQPQQPVEPPKPRVVDFNFVPFAGSDKGCIVDIHNSGQYDKLIANKSKIVVVMITIDSPVCNATKELYIQLAESNAHADFLVIDLNEMKDKILDIANVSKVPYFRFYKDGKMIKDFGGQFMEDTLRAAVTNIVIKAKPKPPPKGVANTGLHSPGVVLNLTTDDMYKNILSVPDVLIVVNFYNHEKISQDMIPAYAEIAKNPEFHSAVFCKIDVNACKNTIRACAGATRLPAFRFFKNGDRLKEWMGNDPDYLENLIKQYNKH